MAGFLVFTLAGPLMAFGDVAPGERRGSTDRPGRSLLLGFLAAALGMRRDDPRHGPLAAALAFAVRVDAPGSAMVDYHTAQTAPRQRKRHFATRREELAIPKEDLGTILSQRTYRVDAAFTVVVLVVADGPFPLEAIAAALERPALPIHAGRRACPLGLPPSPALIEAEAVATAFIAYDQRESANRDRALLRGWLMGPSGGSRLVAVDQEFRARKLLDGVEINRQETRRDQPVDRLRWQFSPRIELVGTLLSARMP